MKAFKTILFIVFLFLSANTVSAQYGNGYGGNGYGGNGYGNGYGGGGYGRNSAQLPQEKNTPKPIPVEVTAAKIVAYYKKELNLDALQEVVFNNIYVKSLKKQEILISKKEMSDEDKTNEFKVLNEMTEMEVNQILNKEQKEKFKNLNDERQRQIETRKH